MTNKTVEFMECDTCRAKPGSPVLCSGCLHNRKALESITQQVREEERERMLDLIKELHNKKESELHGGYDDADFLNAYQMGLHDLFQALTNKEV